LSLKHQFRCMTLCFVLWIGTGVGAPMPPQKLEELFQQMNESKVADTIPVEDDDGDELEDHLLRSGLTSGL
jgi:hypothetical protein